MAEEHQGLAQAWDPHCVARSFSQRPLATTRACVGPPSWLPSQGYRTNAPFTNHALLGLFRRLADPQQLNLEPMLYQVGGCSGRLDV